MFGLAWVVILYGADEAAISSLVQPGLSFCGADEAAISSLVQPGLSFCRGLMLGRAWVVILYRADEAAISSLVQPGLSFCMGQMGQLFHPWSSLGCHFVEV